MKKALGLAICFGATLIFVAACTEEPPQVVVPSSPAQQNTVEKDVVSLPPEAKIVDLSPWQAANINWRQFEGTELSVLADAQPAFRALTPHLHLFEALTGIRVGYQTVEQHEMRDKRQLDLESRAGIYDVVPIGVTFLSQAYHNKWLTPLNSFLSNPLLTDADWYDFEDISANSISLCKKEEQLLSVPFDYSAPIYFYRTDLYTKYGIEPPDTFEDVIEAKHKLQRALDNDGVKDTWAFATRTRTGAGLNTWTVIPTIRAYGGKMYDEQWKPVFDSPQAVQAMEVYRDMVTGFGSPPDATLLHFYEIRELFKSGKLGATILASHMFSEMNTLEKSPIWDKWDAVPMPRGSEARHTSPWAWAFSINSASRNKDAAWLFIQWASSKPTAKLLTDGGGSPRLSVLESEDFKAANPPGVVHSIRWMIQEGTNSPMQTGMAEFPIVGNIASEAFSQIFHGSDVYESLHKAVLESDKAMEGGPTRAALKQSDVQSVTQIRKLNN